MVIGTAKLVHKWEQPMWGGAKAGYDLLDGWWWESNYVICNVDESQISWFGRMQAIASQ